MRIWSEQRGGGGVTVSESVLRGERTAGEGLDSRLRGNDEAGAGVKKDRLKPVLRA